MSKEREAVETHLKKAPTPAKSKQLKLPYMPKTYHTWKNPQLKAACRTRFIKTGGTNQELAAKLENWDRSQTILGFNTLSPRTPKTKNIPPIAPSRVRRRQEVEDEDEDADSTPRKHRNIGEPPDTPIGKLWEESGPRKRTMQEEPQESKGEATKHLEEHKTNKGGRLQQSTLDGFLLNKIKKKENPTEDARSNGNLPNREGGEEEFKGGGKGSIQPGNRT